MAASDSIRQGLAEALDFAAGKTAGAQVHQVNVTQVDVAAIRASTGLSKASSRGSSASPRARSSLKNKAAAAPPAQRKCCWR